MLCSFKPFSGRWLRHKVCLSLILAGLSVAAVADDSLSDALDMSLESLADTTATVEGGAMWVKPLKQQAVAVTVLNAADIQAFGYRTLSDVFNALPGLYTAFDGIYDYAGARGLIGSGNFNSRVLVTIDGYRFNDNIYHQMGLVGKEFPIDLELVERIEFVPGPGGAENGLNAFLGVVNVVTRSAASRHQAELSVSQSNQEYRHGRGTFFTPAAGGSLMVSLGTVQGEGKDGVMPTTGQSVSGLGQESADKLFVKYERGALQANFIASDRFKQVASPLEDTEPKNPNTWYQDIWQLADVRYRLHDSAQFELTSRVHWGHYRFNGNYALPDNVNYRGGADGKWWGVDLNGEWFANEQHTFLGGVSVQDNYSQWLYTGERGAAQAVIDSERATQSAAFWLEDRWQLTDKLQLITGARLDRDMQTNTHFSPRFGAIYQLNPQDTLRFNWANAWITPSDYQLRYGSEDPSSGFQSPNLDLNPERIQSVDLGWEHLNSLYGRVALTGFYYQTDDLIELEVGANNQEVYLNSGQVNATGVQVEWHKHWLSGWRIHSSATMQQVEEIGAEFREDAPQNLFKLNVRTPAVLGIWPAFELQHISERAMRDGQKTEAISLLNTTFTKHFSRDIRAQAAIFNALEAEYFAPVSADFRQPALQQPGRSVRLKLEWRF